MSYIVLQALLVLDSNGSISLQRAQNSSVKVLNTIGKSTIFGNVWTSPTLGILRCILYTQQTLPALQKIGKSPSWLFTIGESYGICGWKILGLLKFPWAHPAASLSLRFLFNDHLHVCIVIITNCWYAADHDYFCAIIGYYEFIIPFYCRSINATQCSICTSVAWYVRGPERSWEKPLFSTVDSLNRDLSSRANDIYHKLGIQGTVSFIMTI